MESIAKYGEDCDPNLFQKWNLYSDPDRMDLQRDVFIPLSKRKNITALSQTWRDLCNASHATKYSQQYLRIGVSPEESGLFLHTDYSLDLLFALLAMNFRLIGRIAKKARLSPYFFDLKSQDLSYEMKMEMRWKCKSLISEYFRKLMDKRAAKLWKPVVSQYRQSWN